MLIIKNGLIYTMETEQPEKLDLLIQDGKIIQIAKQIRMTENMQIIEADGKNVFPGFIDAHSHIGISEEKIGPIGDDCNELSNPVTPTLRAIDAINPMDSAFHNALAAGITSVMTGPGSSNVIGGQFAFIKTEGRCIDDMIVKAPAAMKIAFGENPKNDYGSSQGVAPMTRMGIAALIRRQLFLARQYFEQEKCENRCEPNFEMESYRALFEGEIPLKAHVHRADDIFTAIRIGKEFGLSMTLDHCTEGHLIAERIADAGCSAIVGPNLSARNKDELCIADFKTAGILQKAGVLVALTMDHPVTRIQDLLLCASMAAKEGLGEMNALKSITINAAKICRVDDRVGSLCVGKDADLAIYDGNPLEIGSNLYRTLIDGKVVWPRD